MGRLANKNILITGGNSGIGLAAAQEFDREGSRVAICGLNEGSLQAAKETHRRETAPPPRHLANAGEDRRPILTWLRQIPIEGETPEVVRVATDCGRWLAESRIPKLFINAEPGAVLTGRHREFCRTWRNQTEVTVEGIHFVQEDSPEQIGKALAAFVRSLRSL